MNLRILKRDLKRKRTMNVILLLFITLASLFVSTDVALWFSLEYSVATTYPA